MSIDRWAEFQDSAYRTVDLGRPAVFLIPVAKLEMQMPSGQTVEEELRTFIIEKFAAFTPHQIPSFGIWHDAEGIAVSDACIRYEVSFVGKENIRPLLRKLAEVALAINEDCIYFSAGQYTCLLFPAE